MGKFAKYVGRDCTGRIRITVELDTEATYAVDNILEMLSAQNRPTTISQIVRCAIKHYQSTGDWSEARPRSKNTKPQKNV